MLNLERVVNLLIGLVATAAIAGAFLLDPIPQDPAYHHFADGLGLFGIPNFWNVATNLPFLAIGLAGLLRLSRLRVPALRPHYLVFCIGIALVGVGSAWYHWDPTTPTLVWDRLPMTVAFMALFAALISDRLSPVLGRALLGPLVALGISSIAWWIHTELLGRGDLRPYAVVQFLPLLLIPLLLLRPGALHTGWLWATLGAYIAAKLAEHFDGAILDAFGLFSGHSLKHLLAALGAWCALRAFQRSPARAL
jgi:hypothetical protein